MYASRIILTLAFTLIAAPAFAQDAPKADAPKADAPKADAPKAAPAPAPDPARQAADLYESARKLFFQGKYKDAVAPLVQAVKLDATKSGYKLLLAKAYRLTEEPDKAADLLAAILKENPEHVEAGVTLAELLSSKKQPDKVIAALEPLLKFKRDYPLYHMLGEAYYEKENLDKAREYLEEAVRLNPRAGSDLYQLGNIYLMQSRFAKAAGAYERAADLDVSDDVFHFKLASVYFNLRNYLGQITTAKVIGGKVGDIKDHMLLLDLVPGTTDTFYIAGPRSA
ncbi:MAG: tetratricopeptide repeat protein, partial [Phycisphaeraceae bacterium]